jgi:hypothetical protein
MFLQKTAQMIFANKGLATVIRNKLVKANPEASYDLVKVPTGVEIVRSTPVEPVVVVPEVEPEAKAVVAGETIRAVQFCGH